MSKYEQIFIPSCFPYLQHPIYHNHPDPIFSGAQGGDGPQQEGGGGLGGGKRLGGGGQWLSQIKGAENKSPLYDSWLGSMTWIRLHAVSNDFVFLFHCNVHPDFCSSLYSCGNPDSCSSMPASRIHQTWQLGETTKLVRKPGSIVSSVKGLGPGYL